MLRRFIYATSPPDKWWVKFGAWGCKHYIYHNAAASTDFKTVEFVYDDGVVEAVKVLNEDEMQQWWSRVQEIRNEMWQLNPTDGACMALGTYDGEIQRLHQYFAHPLMLCRWDVAHGGNIISELPKGEEITDRDAVMRYLLQFETKESVHTADGWGRWLKSWFV